VPTGRYALRHPANAKLEEPWPISVRPVAKKSPLGSWYPAELAGTLPPALRRTCGASSAKSTRRNRSLARP